MDRASPFSIGRREYRLKGWFAAIYLLLGSIELLLGLAAVGINFIEPRFSIKVFLIGLFVLAMGAYIVTWTLSNRLIISDSHIEARALWNKSVADLSQIRGFRTEYSRSGKYIRIILKGSTDTIVFSSHFNTDEAFRRWMQRIPDLDDDSRIYPDLEDAPRT